MSAKSLNELCLRHARTSCQGHFISPSAIFFWMGKCDLSPQEWKVFKTISGFLVSGWDHCFRERQRVKGESERGRVAGVTPVWRVVFRLPERLSRQTALGGNAGSGKGQNSSQTNLFVLLRTSERRTKHSHCVHGGCFTPQSIGNICGWWTLVWIIMNK